MVAHQPRAICTLGYHWLKVTISQRYLSFTGARMCTHTLAHTDVCQQADLLFFRFPISENLCLYYDMQEAQSKFNVETEPDNAVVIEPLDGFLGPEGSAMLHFKRSTSSPSMGRVNCKVYYLISFLLITFDLYVNL